MDDKELQSNEKVSISVPVETVEALRVFANEVIRENKSKRRWRNVKGFAISAVVVALAVSGLASVVGKPSGDHVVSVRIEGGIGQGNGSADAIVPSLKKAFDDKEAKAVILQIDSPGGVPSDADRIIQVIEQYKKETGKPVIAIVDGVGASAAYMIAVHADKVVAGRYSLIGSIGAIIQGWDYHEIMDKVGVKQRIFASGKLKSMLNPYVPMTDDAKRKAQEIVDRMATTFVTEVKEYRKGKIKEGDWFSGEVWPGNEALEIGLIDEVGTIDQYVKQNYGEARVVTIKPELPRSLLSVENIAPQMISKAIEGFVAGMNSKN